MKPMLTQDRLILAAIFLLALILRLMAWAAYPHREPLMTDFYIYEGLARNWFAGRGPVLDFLYSLLVLPPAIPFVETYYEPFYGLLLAVPLWLTGGVDGSSVGMPFLAGLAIPLGVYVLSRQLKFSREAWVLAVSLAAVSPLLVERSTSLMKESVVAALSVWGLVWLVPRWRTLQVRQSAVLGLGVVGLGLVQYESLLILGASFSLVFVLQRRWRCWAAFGLAFGSVFLLYSVWFWSQTGLWISSKYLFLLTPYSGAPFEASRSLAVFSVLDKLLSPGLYLWRSLVAFIGIPWLILAAWGVAKERESGLRLPVWCFLGCYFYVHAVAVDLWLQDMLVPLVVLMPWVAQAVVQIKKGEISPFWPALCVAQAALYGLSRAYEISDRIFFSPIWHSRIVIPFGLALLLVAGFWPRLRRTLASPEGRAGLALAVVPLLFLQLLLVLPYEQVMRHPAELSQQADRALGTYLGHVLPPTAVLVVDRPFSLSYYSRLITLRGGPASQLQRYGPTVAVGFSRETLVKWGYQPLRLSSFGSTPIWTLAVPPELP